MFSTHNSLCRKFATFGGNSVRNSQLSVGAKLQLTYWPSYLLNAQRGCPYRWQLTWRSPYGLQFAEVAIADTADSEKDSTAIHHVTSKRGGNSRCCNYLPIGLPTYIQYALSLSL